MVLLDAVDERDKRITELEAKICDELWAINERMWKYRAKKAEAEQDKLREGVRRIKIQHRICRVECINIPGPRECDCGATDYNAQLEALLGEEGGSSP